MNLKSWFDEIRFLAKENIVFFVLAYFLLISALDSSFKMLLGTNLNISLSYFYLNFLSFGILYFLLLSILHFFSNNESIKNSVMRLSSIFLAISRCTDDYMFDRRKYILSEPNELVLDEGTPFIWVRDQ